MLKKSYPVLIIVAAIAFYSPYGLSKDSIKKLMTKINNGVVSFIDYSDGISIVLSKRALYLFNRDDLKEISHYKFGVNEQALRADYLREKNHIFVTSVLGGKPQSYLFSVEHTGKGYRLNIIQKEIPYFLRIIDFGGQEFLLGQSSTKSEPFAGAVYRIIIDGDKFSRYRRINLPENLNIYEFAYYDDSVVWARSSNGKLEKYVKENKWKRVYRSTDRFRGGANCFVRNVRETMTDNNKESVCVNIPPSYFEIKSSKSGKGNSRYLIVDGHSYLLGGVMLKPAVPKKSYLYLMKIEPDGVDECRKYGSFEGWIGWIKKIDDGKLSAEGSRDEISGFDFFVGLNSSEFYSPKSYARRVKISTIDCNSEM